MNTDKRHEATEGSAAAVLSMIRHHLEDQLVPSPAEDPLNDPGGEQQLFVIFS